jgi:uncharacterized protein YciI
VNSGHIRYLLAVIAAALILWTAPSLAQDTPEGKFQVLGKTLWVVITRAAEGAEPDPAAMEAHMAHQMRLEQEGIMFGAGPLYDADGNIQGGMIIIRADSAEDARRIADSDPMHARGLRVYTLQRWMLNEGHISITLDYARGTFTLD